ncbi:MAG: CHAT domain-containing protein [Candidatus Aminicenantes bacterium]|nr:MAG: CHAT domain-containing protein [Candidatus Aminicenantes bacterium]
MSLIGVISTDFIRFSSTETTSDVLQEVRTLAPKYIVVYHVDPNGVGSHYVFGHDDFIDHFQPGSFYDTGSLRESLRLENKPPAATVPPEDVSLANNNDIVVEKNTVVGVVEVDPGIKEAFSVRGLKSTYPVNHNIISPVRTKDFFIEAEFPEEIIIGKEASLVVTLFSPDWATLKKAINRLSLDQTQPLIVIVRTEKFILTDQRECKLSIPGPRHAVSCRFELAAQSLGGGRIEVRLYQGSSQVGEIILKPKIVLESPHPIGMLTRSHQLEPILREPMPDLEIRIFDRTLNGKGTIQFELTAAPDSTLDFYHTPFPMTILDCDPKAYHNRLFEIIEDTPLLDTEDIKAIDLELRNIGRKLFDVLFPKELKEVFLHHSSQIRSIQVLSGEPYIPWEMVLLPKGKGLPEDKFLCEQFIFTRWLEGKRPPSKIYLKKLRYIIPIYKKPELALPMTKKECQLLEKLAHKYSLDIKPIPANRLAVLQTLRNESFDVLHFSGHGSFDVENTDTSILLLESKLVNLGNNEKSEILQKLHSINATALAANPQRRNPLIFLNACQTGRSAFSLTGIGGWAVEFIRAGAGVFVGSHWSIGDHAAFVFAQTFYNKLCAGETVGESTLAARLEVKEKAGNPTWLAYTVFAHPLATITHVDSPGFGGELGRM